MPWPPRLPVLEQRHLDLIGLGLVALGVFLAFPLYLGWEGGEAGQAIVDGLTWAIGRVAWATPVALVAAGALLVLRPALPAGVRPFRAGGCACCRRLPGARGRHAGLRAGRRARPWPSAAGTSARSWPMPATRLFSDVGAHILAVFLFCAALLLLTGATVAGVLRATGEQVVETARTLRPPSRPRQPPGTTRTPPSRCVPPDLEDEEVVIRPATRTGELDGALRYPDLFEAAVAPPARAGGRARPSPRARARARAGARAPRPRTSPTTRRSRRSSTSTPATSSSACPTRASSSARRAEQVKPDTAGQEKTAARLVEALGHLGVQAQVIGAVAGPHITRYELQLAPGVKMAKVANLKNDLAYALAATEIRILAPIPGKRRSASRSPTATAASVTLGDVFSEPPEDFSPLTVWLGKDVVGQGDRRRPGQDAAPARGRHHRRGQVGRHQRDALLDPAARDARRGAARARRPQAGRAQPLRGDPASAHAGHHRPRMAANALQNLVREMEWRYGVMSVKRTRSLPSSTSCACARATRRCPTSCASSTSSPTS